jgi:atypical dual specificity phosphatase
MDFLRVEHKGITNVTYNKIRDNIWVGSQLDNPEQIGELRSKGITAILNIGAEVNDPAGRDFGLLLVKVGIAEQDHGDEPRIAAALATLDYLISAGHVVYLHCAAGHNRSPYIASLYLAKKENRSFDSVLGDMIRMWAGAANAATILGRWYGKEWPL